MAEAEILNGNALDLAGSAYDIITARQFDYFSSRSEAKLHGRAEGVDLRRLSKTKLGYTKMPRDYDPGGWLPEDLGNTFDELESGVYQTFLHLDRSAVTLGMADNQDGNAIGNLQLVVPERGRSCALRLPCLSVVRHRFSNILTEITHQEAGSETFVDLPIGRSLVDPESEDAYEARAIRDSFRDWENVLVIGGSAVASFIEHALEASTEEGYAGDRQSAVAGGLEAVMVGGIQARMAFLRAV